MYRNIDKQWVRFIKRRDLRMCHPQTSTEWRNTDLVFFHESSQNFPCVCDAILTLSENVTIIFSQISRKEGCVRDSEAGFMPAVIGCYLKINQQTFQQSIHHKVYISLHREQTEFQQAFWQSCSLLNMWLRKLIYWAQGCSLLNFFFLTGTFFARRRELADSKEILSKGDFRARSLRKHQLSQLTLYLKKVELCQSSHLPRNESDTIFNVTNEYHIQKQNTQSS